MSNIFINYFLGGNMKINFTKLVMLIITIQVTVLTVIAQMFG
jgi:hypothetical protein